MDLWSDLNLVPFMAVTAHWIEAKTVKTGEGMQHVLTLRADLVGFHHVPGHHSGENLSERFLHVLERINVAHKVCFI